MNAIIRNITAAVFAVAALGSAGAATLAEYTFQNHSIAASTVDASVSASSASLVGGWATGNNSYIYIPSSAGIPVGAINQSQYTSFSVDTLGNNFNLDTLYYDLGGWTNYSGSNLTVTTEVYAQVNGGTAFLVGSSSLLVPPGGQTQWKPVSVVLSTFQDLQNVQGSLGFLIYAYTDINTGAAQNRYTLSLDNVGLTATAVPEPSSAALIAGGVIAFCALRRRRRTA